MPKLEYQDHLVRVETGVDIGSNGSSFSQQLNDGISIKITSGDAHVIQFKCRLARWLDGPAVGKFLSDDDIPGTSPGLDNLKWDVDALHKPDPYYDNGGAHVRTETDLTIYDQPDVSYDQSLYFEQGKDLSDMKSYDIRNIFCAASIVIANNRVKRVVAWTRKGVRGAASYKVEVREINSLSEPWKNVLRTNGYSIPELGN